MTTSLSSAEYTDAQLISRVRSGDPDAYGQIYERHHEAALVAARRFCKNTRQSPEDCVADAFTQVLATLRNGKGPDEFFRAYLYTVMRNSLQSHWQKDSESVTVDDFEVIERHSKAHKIDPVITRFETKVVRSAFSSLPERWQSVLWYSEIEGMKPAEVAPILGLSPHGVSMLRTRAREGLRTAYLHAHLNEVPAGTACAGVASKLGGYVRMTIAARDRTQVSAHLAECADCNAMSAEVRNVNRGLLGIIALLFLGSNADDILGVLGRGAGAASRSGAAFTSTIGKQSGSFASRIGTRRAVGTTLTAIGAGALLSMRSHPKRTATAAVGATATAAVALLLMFPGDQTPPADTEPGTKSSEEVVTNTTVTDDVVDSAVDDGTIPDDPETPEDSDALTPEQAPVPEEPQQNTPAPTAEAPTAPSAPSPAPAPNPTTPAAPPAAAPPTTPPPAAPVNLMSNGGFDGPIAGGEYFPGDVFNGWTVGATSLADPAGKTLQIWYPEMGEPGISYASPFPQGPWARIMGVISQSIPTEVGQTYVIEYEARASGAGANNMAVGWAGGNELFAAVNGVRVDTFVTVVTPLYTPRSVTFVATTPFTEISFGNAAGGAIGIDSVSVKLVP